MKIYCTRCNYKFIPKTINYSMAKKRCPACGSLKSLARESTTQDILDNISDDLSLKDEKI